MSMLEDQLCVALEGKTGTHKLKLLHSGASSHRRVKLSSRDFTDSVSKSTQSLCAYTPPSVICMYTHELGTAGCP